VTISFSKNILHHVAVVVVVVVVCRYHLRLFADSILQESQSQNGLNLA
jgi:hypothetical protein